MMQFKTTAALLSVCVGLACTPGRFVPSHYDVDLRVPKSLGSIAKDSGLLATPSMSQAGVEGSRQRDDDGTNPLMVEDVVRSVTSRYPPMLSALLENDLASGRLTEALGGFDTKVSAKVVDRLRGFYEATTAEGLVEAPLATGDDVYGGYRVSDGYLPDYYDGRTQSGGEFVLGVRVPLLRGRSTDARRAAVRKAQIGVELAEPEIAGARLDYVRAASLTYYKWHAAGQKLRVARELLRLAEARKGGLESAVERQFLAPIDVTDNERLITQRRIYVTRAERAFQSAALGLSLYYRGDDDRPIVVGEGRLPESSGPLRHVTDSVEDALAIAKMQRPDFVRVRLLIDDAETDRALATNDRLPDLDLIVEGTRSIGDGPYTDRRDHGLFVGGKLSFPVQRRRATGKLAIAEAKLEKLMLEQRFLEERVTNEILDVRSELQNAAEQLTATERNLELAQQLVDAEVRSFELGRSDLLRVQLREAQLADARVLSIDARLAYESALVDYAAMLGNIP
ncbi:MAG: TolC family protein [Planctomycetes bacterium]|nr:TolC family protein [Planctomycetota bacterium]